MFAIVTGGNSGLGEALSLALEAKQYEVLRVGRNAPLSLDLTRPEDLQKLTDLIAKRPPDLLINNAGIGFYGKGICLSLEEQKQTLRLNTEVVLELTLTAAKALISHQKQGTIVNISSAASLFPFPNFAIYAASKAATTSFSCALDQELSPLGIRVLTSLPGQIATPFRLKAAKQDPRGPAPYPKCWTLTPKHAAHLILKQISQGKRSQIIDWRYRLAYRLSRLIPNSLLMKMLENSISKRM